MASKTAELIQLSQQILNLLIALKKQNERETKRRPSPKGPSKGTKGSP